MKTEIDANGKLKISPESEIESFALKMWWADYNSIHSDVGGEEHFAALHVETIVPVIAPNVELRGSPASGESLSNVGLGVFMRSTIL